MVTAYFELNDYNHKAITLKVASSYLDAIIAEKVEEGLQSRKSSLVMIW